MQVLVELGDLVVVLPDQPTAGISVEQVNVGRIQLEMDPIAGLDTTGAGDLRAQGVRTHCDVHELLAAQILHGRDCAGNAGSTVTLSAVDRIGTKSNTLWFAMPRAAEKSVASAYSS